jgi:hypothetical protein
MVFSSTVALECVVIRAVYQIELTAFLLKGDRYGKGLLQADCNRPQLEGNE